MIALVEPFQLRCALCDVTGNLLPLQGVDVLIRIVQNSVKVGQKVHQMVIDAVDAPTHHPGELSGGVPGGLRSLGVDEVDDRLRLNQVQLAVEEGPPGELPGLACRAPAWNRASSAALSTAGEPWHCSSAVSSPV